MSMPLLATLDPGGCPCDMPSCLCNPEERTLRCIAAGTHGLAMQDGQRQECLREIGSVEGYSKDDYAGASDRDLARGVLHAWADYCRDKGMM